MTVDRKSIAGPPARDLLCHRDGVHGLGVLLPPPRPDPRRPHRRPQRRPLRRAARRDRRLPLIHQRKLMVLRLRLPEQARVLQTGTWDNKSREQCCWIRFNFASGPFYA